MTFAFLKFLLTKLITSRSILIQFEGRDYLIDNNTEPLILKINQKKFLVKFFSFIVILFVLIFLKALINSDLEP